MRLFVAAEPSERVRSSAVACIHRLRARLEAARAAEGIRWVAAGNLHLTVWFLGEVSDQRGTAVLDALRPALDLSAFDLHLAGFGAFPPSGPPRVLWMGVTQGLEELARAHDEIGTRLQPWGFAPEGRAYSAHLTVARVKEAPHGAARAALRQALAHDPGDAGSCRIRALTVFRSRTSAGGAVYERLLRVPLR
ncbi:MAG TPA: RNA 2',3'-cyclic phosphodiesterase [Vicinamibacterales bacterium]|nr:RNA 2',3'-cyclic phosphodiesterase [Vicinamibacterales bacterium]